MNPRHEHFLVIFYNSIALAEATCWEDIPPAVQEVIIFFPYETIVAPEVARYISTGKSRSQAAQKFGVTQGVARSIAKRYGLYPRRKKV